MPRKFPTKFGYVPIYPKKIKSDDIHDIKNNGYFQLEAGAIFGNCLVNRLNSDLENDFKVIHFDPGAITDRNEQAIYSIVYQKGVKKLPLLGIRYGEKQYILITNENHPKDGIKIRKDMSVEMKDKLEKILTDLNSQSKIKFSFKYV